MLSVRLNRLVLRQTSYATRLISEVCRVGCGSSFILKLCVRLPEWHGWHAARRGLGSNLYRLGVPDMVIQRILRHANVSTTATYYIKTAADDVKHAMEKLENNMPQTSPMVGDTHRTLETHQEAE